MLCIKHFEGLGNVVNLQTIGNEMLSTTHGIHTLQETHTTTSNLVVFDPTICAHQARGESRSKKTLNPPYDLLDNGEYEFDE